jgi:hypothetical protein
MITMLHSRGRALPRICDATIWIAATSLAAAAAGWVAAATLDTLTSRALRMVGMGGEADKLKVGINHAAEDAVADAKPILKAALHNRYAGKAAELGLVHKHDADLNDYVTAKALDGLFSRIADEERAIRKDPLRQANSLIKKVFGAVR